MLKIKNLDFEWENIFKFEDWFSNKIDFGFQLRISLSEIICIVCANICDRERFGQNFNPWNRVGIANNLSLALANIVDKIFHAFLG